MTGAVIIAALETGLDDDHGWNNDSSERLSVRLFTEALTVWLILRNSDASLREAQAAFNTTEFVIRQAASFGSELGLGYGQVFLKGSREAWRAYALELDRLSRAIQVISVAQNAPVSIVLVASLLQISEEEVRQAISEHPYMCEFQGNIEHDGP